MNPKPFVYLAFANQLKGEKSEGFLPALRQEMQGLKDAFLPFVVNDSISWLTDENASADSLATSLPRIGTQDERPKIIHFSGHAGKDYWKLTDERLTDNRLDNLFFGMKNVALVFMNACCTEPLRHYLLEKVGVKAVIATSESIKDGEATDFSIAFYNNLVLQGKTLEAAFRHACGTLNFFPTEDVPRGLARKGTPQNEFAWGIYWQDDAAKSWVFNNNLANGIPLGLENVWKELADIRQQITQKEAEVQQQLQAANLDLIIQTALQSPEPLKTVLLNNAQVTKNTLLEPLKKLYAEADEMRKALESVDRNAKLKNQIDQFNFNSEIKNITQKHPKLPNGVYILRGQEGAGLGFLSKRLSVLLRNFSETYRPVRIDLGAVANGRAGVFVELKRGLKLTQHAASTLPDLARAFHNTILALPTSDPYVLIVDNIQTLFDDDLKAILSEFWVTLHTELLQNPINRRIMLLLLWRIDDEFEETRDITTALPTDLTKDCVVCVADEIAPLTPQYLSDWCIERADIFNDLALDAEQHFFDVNAPLVVPTLLRMAQKMQSSDLEKYIFDQDGLKFCKT
ncbi:MAG: CHAT domain-containing protein [Saprospiraceae bacterium]|nr:CHAT domain-containing protein [Saprospiraceae bacterium]